MMFRTRASSWHWQLMSFMSTGNSMMHHRRRRGITRVIPCSTPKLARVTSATERHSSSVHSRSFTCRECLGNRISRQLYGRWPRRLDPPQWHVPQHRQDRWETRRPGMSLGEYENLAEKRGDSHLRGHLSVAPLGSNGGLRGAWVVQRRGTKP